MKTIIFGSDCFVSKLIVESVLIKGVMQWLYWVKRLEATVMRYLDDEVTGKEDMSLIHNFFNKVVVHV